MTRARHVCGVNIRGMDIEVLPHDGNLKHLDQIITCRGRTQSEFQHRISGAWVIFALSRQELSSCRNPLKHSLRLSDATGHSDRAVCRGHMDTYRIHEPNTQWRTIRMIFHTRRQHHNKAQFPPESDFDTQASSEDDITKST